MTDYIDRQAAIEIIQSMYPGMPRVPGMRKDWQKRYEPYIRMENAIRELPSAQPETAKRIVGKSRDGMTLWYQCDMCNEPVDAQDKFCRGCGRRLTDG